MLHCVHSLLSDCVCLLSGSCWTEKQLPAAAWHKADESGETEPKQWVCEKMIKHLDTIRGKCDCFKNTFQHFIWVKTIHLIQYFGCILWKNWFLILLMSWRCIYISLKFRDILYQGIHLVLEKSSNMRASPLGEVCLVLGFCLVTSC